MDAQSRVGGTAANDGRLTMSARFGCRSGRAGRGRRAVAGGRRGRDRIVPAYGGRSGNGWFPPLQRGSEGVIFPRWYWWRWSAGSRGRLSSDGFSPRLGIGVSAAIVRKSRFCIALRRHKGIRRTVQRQTLARDRERPDHDRVPAQRLMHRIWWPVPRKLWHTACTVCRCGGAKASGTSVCISDASGRG